MTRYLRFRLLVKKNLRGSKTKLLRGKAWELAAGVLTIDESPFGGSPAFHRTGSLLAWSEEQALRGNDRQEFRRLLTAYDGHLYAGAAVNRADVSFKVGRDGEQRAGVSGDKESRKSLAEQFRSTHSELSGQQRLATDGGLRVNGNLDVSNLSGTLTDHDNMLNVSLLLPRVRALHELLAVSA